MPGQAAAGRPKVLLGVAGGIAAYKACEVLRRLTESGHDVQVLPTEAALRFVGTTTWEALSGHPVATDVFTGADAVPHVRLGREADLVLVVPATADLMSRAAHGRADDLLTGTLLTARCPVVYAPAMHTEMWEHPATVENVATLRRYGALVVDPASGRLTGADTGPGRLPDPDELVRTARLVLERGAPPPRDLAGCTVVVTAGGTREYLDPVRFLGNRSSGKQGYAIARAAVLRGATVRLVTANVPLAAPSGAQITAVTSAQQLRDATLAAAKDADIVVMAAAVADFRPAQAAEYKIKKDGRDPAPVALVQNADVLVELAQQRREGVSPAAQVLVGFAAETGSPTASVLELGRAKLARKGADLLVVNEVGAGRGFETEENAGVILGRDGSETVLPIASKDLLAHALWDRVTAAG